MAGVMNLACLVLACMVLAGPMVADAQIGCGSVTSSLAPCISYLTRGGAVPPACCAGVRRLNSAANSTPARQAACRCLQSAARNIPGLNQGAASGLPRACGVNVPYPISTSTNCNNVK
ncbi:PREDICTED: non-specific lipid-transfer protein A-like [Tarenaya hassleriana]|uniref:non-specific lipid-transfer protein A-like n=1 Tax=Tarenaya hassleriana TaxID=28532 RepID=UPI00053C378D|nr:PREDICTED: non-specific lipid-transfer protein A-like [Tarenaya hassleriana]